MRCRSQQPKKHQDAHGSISLNLYTAEERLSELFLRGGNEAMLMDTKARTRATISVVKPLFLLFPRLPPEEGRKFSRAAQVRFVLFLHSQNDRKSLRGLPGKDL